MAVFLLNPHLQNSTNVRYVAEVERTRKRCCWFDVNRPTFHEDVRREKHFFTFRSQ